MSFSPGINLLEKSDDEQFDNALFIHTTVTEGYTNLFGETFGRTLKLADAPTSCSLAGRHNFKRMVQFKWCI